MIMRIYKKNKNADGTRMAKFSHYLVHLGVAVFTTATCICAPRCNEFARIASSFANIVCRLAKFSESPHRKPWAARVHARVRTTNMTPEVVLYLPFPPHPASPSVS